MLRPLALLAGLGLAASIAPTLVCLPARADSVQFRSTVSEVDACNRAQALVPQNGTVTTMRVKQNNESNGSYAFTCRVNWSSSTKAKPTWMPILFGPVWS
jgi:hypothetical protein